MIGMLPSYLDHKGPADLSGSPEYEQILILTATDSNTIFGTPLQTSLASRGELVKRCTGPWANTKWLVEPMLSPSPSPLPTLNPENLAVAEWPNEIECLNRQGSLKVAISLLSVHPSAASTATVSPTLQLHHLPLLTAPR